MSVRLISYMDKNKFLTDKQYGFHEKHSTYMALIELIDHITEEQDNSKFSLGIFIDLSKLLTQLTTKYYWINYEYMGSEVAYCG